MKTKHVYAFLATIFFLTMVLIARSGSGGLTTEGSDLHIPFRTAESLKSVATNGAANEINAERPIRQPIMNSVEVERPIRTGVASSGDSQKYSTGASLLADFTSLGGTWHLQPPTPEGEPVRHWLPTYADDPKVSFLHQERRSSKKTPLRPWRRFSQTDALSCLSGKTFLLVGNSNTRTLLTALQSLLEGTPQMSRVSAKQQCDNSKHNHSCWIAVEPASNSNISKALQAAGLSAGTTEDMERSYRHIPKGVVDTSGKVFPIQLKYVSYVKGLYDPELVDRVARPFMGAGGSSGAADLVIMSVGLNFLQKWWDDVWRKEHNEAIVPLSRMIKDYLERTGREREEEQSASSSAKRSGVFMWHTTGPLCRAMPHFHRYKYKKSVWQQRSLADTNAAIEESNQFVATRVLPRVVSSSEVDPVVGSFGSPPHLQQQPPNVGDRLVFIDGHAMLSPADPANKGSAIKAQLVKDSNNTDLCDMYDDPLHHRFFDRELVQVILNNYC